MKGRQCSAHAQYITTREHDTSNSAPKHGRTKTRCTPRLLGDGASRPPRNSSRQASTADQVIPNTVL
eukprot:4424447-Pleurochrysis_carterae.AAC.1